MKSTEITIRLHSQWHHDNHITWIDLTTWWFGFQFILFNVRFYFDIGRSWER